MLLEHPPIKNRTAADIFSLIGEDLQYMELDKRYTPGKAELHKTFGGSGRVLTFRTQHGELRIMHMDRTTRVHFAVDADSDQLSYDVGVIFTDGGIDGDEEGLVPMTSRFNEEFTVSAYRGTASAPHHPLFALAQRVPELWNTLWEAHIIVEP